MKQIDRVAQLLVGVTALGLPATALAQDDSLVDPDNAAETAIVEAKSQDEGEGDAAEAQEDEDGWDVALSVGANGGSTFVNNVVGASADGWTHQLGIVVSGGADWTHGQHAIQNALNIQHTRTKTPQLDFFVKSADLMTLNSTYLYSLKNVDWLGPFGRFKLTTSLFPGYEVYSDPVVISETSLDTVPGDDPIVPDPNDGLSAGEIAPQQKIPLTGSFEPLVMRQSGGLFANPLDGDALKLKTKLGAGVQETITQGGYVNADDDATDVVEYTQLSNSVQAGGELSLDLSGTLKKNLTWSATAGFFLPLVTTGDAPVFMEGLDSDLGLNIGIKLAKWASLEYALSARKVPTVSPDWQVQTGIMLTASFNVIE